MSKTCVVCKKDLGEALAAMDRQGNYYCPACQNRGRGAAAASAPAASASIAESAALALVDIAQDTGPFHKIGGQFSVPGAKFMGPAVASPRAVYLVKAARQQSGYGGGLVGVMLSAALSKENAISTCQVKDLPAGTQAALDPKGKMRETDVVVLACNTVSYVKAGSVNNAITITIGTEKFSVITGVFSVGKCKRQLQDMGWKLNTPLSPTVAPIHNMQSPAEATKADGPGLAKRVALIAGAVLLIILVIVLRVALGH